jgi:hypothetical protein
MTIYQVQVTREGDQWLADVPELEGTQTYASNLTSLERYVREIIVLGADLPDEAIGELDLSWSYDVGDPLIDQANRLRAERADLAAKEKVLEQETRELAVQLTRNYSVRDTGPLLGISHQRVSQLTPEDHRKRNPRQLRQAASTADSGRPRIAAAKKAVAKKAAPTAQPAKKTAARKEAPVKAPPPLRVVPTKSASTRRGHGHQIAPLAAKGAQSKRVK